jgi:hypothetical protein
MRNSKWGHISLFLHHLFQENSFSPPIHVTFYTHRLSIAPDNNSASKNEIKMRPHVAGREAALGRREEGRLTFRGLSFSRDQQPSLAGFWWILSRSNQSTILKPKSHFHDMGSWGRCSRKLSFLPGSSPTSRDHNSTVVSTGSWVGVRGWWAQIDPARGSPGPLSFGPVSL